MLPSVWRGKYSRTGDLAADNNLGSSDLCWQGTKLVVTRQILTKIILFNFLSKIQHSTSHLHGKMKPITSRSTVTMILITWFRNIRHQGLESTVIFNIVLIKTGGEGVWRQRWMFRIGLASLWFILRKIELLIPRLMRNIFWLLQWSHVEMRNSLMLVQPPLNTLRIRLLFSTQDLRAGLTSLPCPVDWKLTSKFD